VRPSRRSLVLLVRSLGQRVGAMVLLVVVVCSGCASVPGAKPPTHTDLRVVASDPLALSDALEVLIAAGQDTPADRRYAYEAVRTNHDDTAAAAFARAAITGRLVQQHGLRMAGMVEDVERDARRSRELDPDFRDGAATRLLGTLYVIAPASLLEQGDSETGLELLKELVAKRPDVLENQLRVAEAYVALGDPAPARAHLCRCVADKELLRPDEQRLLEQLLSDADLRTCP
jgi:hypothetical protein